MDSLRGVFVPVTTPFVGDRVAPDFLVQNIAKWETSGVAGYVVLGSTGEAGSLEDQEALELVKAARQAIPRGKTLIVGIGRESAFSTLRWADRLASAGADYGLCVTPHYFKPAMSKAALMAYFSKLAEQLSLPLLLYNIPQFTGVSLPPDAVAELAAHPNIVGLKDSSGDLVQLARVVGRVPPDFAVLIGHGELLAAGILVGAHGAILAMANATPELCLHIYDLCHRGKWEEAVAVQRRLSALVEKVELAYGVAGIKAAMELRGFVGGPPRLPLLPLKESELATIAQVLRSGER